MSLVFDTSVCMYVFMPCNHKPDEFADRANAECDLRYCPCRIKHTAVHGTRSTGLGSRDLVGDR